MSCSKGAGGERGSRQSRPPPFPQHLILLLPLLSLSPSLSRSSVEWQANLFKKITRNVKQLGSVFLLFVFFFACLRFSNPLPLAVNLFLRVGFLLHLYFFLLGFFFQFAGCFFFLWFPVKVSSHR